MQKLRLNDEVVVLAGRDKGKTGKLVNINWKTNRVVVEGVNLVKKATKPSQANDKGGIVEMESTVHVSNVLPKSPKTGKPSRVKIESRDGKNVRVLKTCGTVLN